MEIKTSSMALPGGILDDFPPQHRPVRDLDGRELRFVRVAQGERTCRQCGETVAANANFCIRCSDPETGVHVRDFIPTMSYLQSDGFVAV